MGEAPPLRVGIAGLGMAGADIVAALASFEDVALVAAADPRDAARAAFVERYGGRSYVDVAALVEDDDVDAVWIATPTPAHAEHACLAAAHGKHVVVEKPFAVTLEECDAMIATARAADVVLLAGGSRSFEPDYEAIRRIVGSGELGALLALGTTCYTSWIVRPRLPGEVEVAHGGGTVYNQAPHAVDVLRLIGGGRVATVRAMTAGGMEQRPCPSYFAAYLEFEDGTPATITYDGAGYIQGWEFVPWGETPERLARSEAEHDYRRRLRGGIADEDPHREQLRFGASTPPRNGARPWIPNDAGLLVVTCAAGGIRQSARGLFVYDDDGRHERLVDRRGGARRREVDELLAAIDGVAPLHSGEWGAATLEVVLALMDSAARHAEVRLQRQVAVDSAV